MGYFSNGTEGIEYEDEYCIRCVHYDTEGGCPVWNLHLDYSYELCNAKGTPGKTMLDTLIPPGDDFNGQCAMFYRKNAVGDLFTTQQEHGDGR